MFDKDINRSYLAVRWFVVQAPMTIRSRDLSFWYVTFERKHPVDRGWVLENLYYVMYYVMVELELNWH